MKTTEQQVLIANQETRVRDMFFNDFSKNYKELVELPITSGFKTCVDLSGITSTNQTAFIELKERLKPEYTIQNLSGSTLLEHDKMMEFRFINSDYPNSELTYFNYYSNNSGYISFNIKARIDTNSKDIIDCSNDEYQKTNYTSDTRLKPSHYLKYNPEIDVMYVELTDSQKDYYYLSHYEAQGFSVR